MYSEIHPHDITAEELKASRQPDICGCDRAFFGKLENVADPEQKRKIIGGKFIRVFEEEARKLVGIDFLGQGTIYPISLRAEPRRQKW